MPTGTLLIHLRFHCASAASRALATRSRIIYPPSFHVNASFLVIWTSLRDLSDKFTGQASTLLGATYYSRGEVTYLFCCGPLLYSPGGGSAYGWG